MSKTESLPIHKNQQQNVEIKKIKKQNKSKKHRKNSNLKNVLLQMYKLN